jgi:hypothetical protein
VTKEQWIVIGVLAAAFVAGWIARAVLGRRDRRHDERHDRRQPGPHPPAVVLDEDLELAVEATKKELDRAIRSYLAALALSARARNPASEPADPLAEEVSTALQDDAANESMLSAVDDRPGRVLSERELDLTDWGFAYGVAWARARDRSAGEPGDAVAHEALRVAETVFNAYAAEAEWALEGDQSESARKKGNGRDRENGRGTGRARRARSSR